MTSKPKPTNPDRQPLTVDEAIAGIETLVPMHAYREGITAMSRWTWTTPDGQWHIKLDPDHPRLTLNGSRGIAATLPRDSDAFRGLRALLHEVGAIRPPIVEPRMP
jgi:hypothetical protein